MKNKKIIALMGGIAVVLGYFVYQNMHPAKPAPVKQKSAVHAAQELHYAPNAPQLAYLKIQNLTEVPEPATEPLAARIAYDENVTARVSAPIAGRVMKLGAQPGDKVVAGQPLLWLDSPDFGSAASDLGKAEADARQKELAYARAKTLYDGEVLARKDMELAETDFKQSRAELQRARLRMANLNYGNNGVVNEQFALRTPISGIVAERQVNPGMEVRPDSPLPLFVVTDPAHVWAMIDLPERDLGKIHTGQMITVEVDAYPGIMFQGRVASVGEALDPASRRIQVRCELPNPNRQLKPEMYARVTLLADGSRKVVRVLNSALLTTGLYYFVFVEKSPGVLVKRRVNVSLQGREFSIVKDGLQSGDRVVTSGALLLNSELSSGE